MNYRFLPPILCLLTLLCGTELRSQSKLSVRINSSFDDLEEWIAGPPTQNQTVGTIDYNSSDLEFGYENSNKDPQLVGLRFTNITIPKGSLITRAYIQFTVDATAKNADPCNVVIRIEPSDNAAKLDSNKFHLSNRSKSIDSVLWNVSGSSWGTVGSAGPDQRTADLAKLVQSVVDRSGWTSGNALAFYMKGSGTREVESYDGDAPKAPLLVIEYVSAVTLSTRINSSFDDLEEWIAGPPTQTKTVGEIDYNSSDLEFGYESSTQDPQLVGLRFNNISIPKGSMIRNAYLQFTVDATAKNADPCKVVIRFEPTDNASKLDSNKFHLTNRTKSADSVLWTVSGASWGTVGAAGADQRTPNIASLIQAIIDRNGWASGNSIALFMKGSGTREVESYDGDAPKAPLLVVEYIPLLTKSVRVNNAFDDLEEWIAGPPTQSKTVGEIDYNSSDLEFGYESSTQDPQLVGLRFNNIPLENSAIVKNAYIQFTVDATSKNADPCKVIIRCDPADNAAKLDSNKFHLTNRTKSADSVVWAVSGSGWGTVGSAGVDQRTPNLGTLVQSLVNRPGWANGNSMAFFMKGTGTREVESYDGDAPKAPLLVLEYYGDNGGSGPVTYIPNPVTPFPLQLKQKWNYWDKLQAPSALWKDTLNNDTTWLYGTAPIGYGDAHIATAIGFGGNAGNKYVTSWFRKTISIADMNQLSDTLELNILHDDGVVIYINGTEVLRRNMPSGTLDSATLSSKSVDGMRERVLYSYDIPKTFLRKGKNVIAAELHQSSSSSDDIGFDMELKNRSMVINPLAGTCNSGSDGFISCFKSIVPIEKVDSMNIPASHNFQKIFEDNQAYTKGGNAKTNFDFTGYVPKNGSSTEGWLSINHETNPGGVSILDIHFDCQTGVWVVDSSQGVDFTKDIVKTASNCSGGVTPWGTIVTAEETTSNADDNSDGYLDLGWLVEIDPKTKKVVQYGTGKNQKLWAMGRINHENVCFRQDSITAYFGEDQPNGSLYKFIASQKTNFYNGTLYVLKLDSALNSSGDPKANKGVWVQVPNTSQSERNYSKIAALGLGATLFNGIEDAEIHPLTGQIYFTAKGNNRTYRFTDNGTTVTNFETYIGGKSYRITTPEGIVSESWGGGNDNLTFDSRGNLYVLQDGGRDHVWVVKDGHTQNNPKVEVFMTTPIGSEPTGMTFTPNEKFFFISIQSPAPGNTVVQKDAKGNDVIFNKSTTLVISRDEAFRQGSKASFTVNDATQCLTGNNFVFTNTSGSGVTSAWTFGNGATSGFTSPAYTYSASGNPRVTLKTTDINNGCIDSASNTMNVYPKPASLNITGNTTVSKNSTHNYSVTGKAGSSYQWSITGGTQSSGGTTNAISVTWGNTSTTGKVTVVETDANGCKSDAAVLNITVNTTGISDILNIRGLKVYPNPVNDVLYIECDEVINMTLIDISGKTIMKASHTGLKEATRMDLSELSKGIYYLKIDNGSNTVVLNIFRS